MLSRSIGFMETGHLNRCLGSPFPSGGYSISLTADTFGGFVYVANCIRDISAYRVLENGSLVPVPGSPFPILGAGEPITVVVEPSDRFLYAANFGAANISSYQISPNGVLTPLAGSPTPTGGAWYQSMAMDPFGRFLYALEGVQGLDIFRINNVTGLPEVVNNIAVGNDSDNEPFAVAVDPLGKFVYEGNANDLVEPGPTSLRGFQIGLQGALTPVPGSPFFPSLPIPSYPDSIVMAPSEKGDFDEPRDFDANE